MSLRHLYIDLNHLGVYPDLLSFITKSGMRYSEHEPLNIYYPLEIKKTVEGVTIGNDKIMFKHNYPFHITKGNVEIDIRYRIDTEVATVGLFSGDDHIYIPDPPRHIRLLNILSRLMYIYNSFDDMKPFLRSITPDVKMCEYCGSVRLHYHNYFRCMNCGLINITP